MFEFEEQPSAALGRNQSFRRIKEPQMNADKTKNYYKKNFLSAFICVHLRQKKMQTNLCILDVSSTKDIKFKTKRVLFFYLCSSVFICGY
jgi:hypothetical protein